MKISQSIPLDWDIFLLFHIFTIECWPFTIILCSHHSSLLASRRFYDQTMTVSSHLSRKIANDHFVSISSKQMEQMYSQNLRTKGSSSSHLLESTDHMYSTVSTSMRSRERNHSTMVSSISSLSRLSSQQLCSIQR